MQNDTLTHYEQCLVDLYKGDPGITYDLNEEELWALAGLVGEDECIIDAILKKSREMNLRPMCVVVTHSRRSICCSSAHSSHAKTCRDCSTHMQHWAPRCHRSW